MNNVNIDNGVMTIKLKPYNDYLIKYAGYGYDIDNKGNIIANKTFTDGSYIPSHRVRYSSKEYNNLLDYMTSYIAASNLLSKEDILFRLEYYTNKKDYVIALNKMFIHALGLNNKGIKNDK